MDNPEGMVSEEKVQEGFDAIREFHRGNYRPSIKFEMEFYGITLTEAVKSCRKSRIEKRHRHYIASSGGLQPKDNYYYPHCPCGWRGAQVKTREEAEAIKCPTLLKQLKTHNLENYQKPTIGD